VGAPGRAEDERVASATSSAGTVSSSNSFATPLENTSGFYRAMAGNYFSGKGQPKFFVWKHAIDTAFQMNNIREDNKVRLAIQCTKDSAQEQIILKGWDAEAHGDWTAFAEQLSKRYGHMNETHVYLQRIRELTCTDVHQLSTYCDRFEEFYSYTEGLEGSAAVFVFLEQMPPDVQDKIREAKPKTLAQAVERARELALATAPTRRQGRRSKDGDSDHWRAKRSDDGDGAGKRRQRRGHWRPWEDRSFRRDKPADSADERKPNRPFHKATFRGEGGGFRHGHRGSGGGRRYGRYAEKKHHELERQAKETSAAPSSGASKP
jgi:hypothetical protein